MNVDDEYKDSHRLVLELLPWYVNDSLEASEQALVKNHLRNCLPCRSEFKKSSFVAESLLSSADDGSTLQSFNHLMARIDKAESTGKLRTFLQKIFALPAVFYRSVIKSNPFVQVALAIQTVFLVAAITYIFSIPLFDAQTNSYHTLSSSEVKFTQHQADIRVVFNPELTVQGIRDIMRTINGEIIEGPSAVGAYSVVLKTASDNRSILNAVGLLKEDPGVILAEKVVVITQ